MIMRIGYILSLFLFISCGFANNKQRDTKEIDTLAYLTVDTVLPVKFDLSVNARIENKQTKPDGMWLNIVYPKYHATIYCTYLVASKDEIAKSFDDNYRLIDRQMDRTLSITEQEYQRDEDNLYGVIYELKGNSATPIQFYLTDSARHFFRGSLYFESAMSNDSVNEFTAGIKKDIIKLFETFKWEK